MKADQIVVGGHYAAKVNDAITTVRVDAIRTVDYRGIRKDATVYDVTNVRTGRKTTFRSAAKFRGVAKPVTNDSVWMNGGNTTEPISVKACDLPAKPSDAKKVGDSEVTWSELFGRKPEGDDSSDPTPTSPVQATERPSAASVTTAVGTASAARTVTAMTSSTTSGLAARLAQRATERDTSHHVVVRALAGTGKTFTQIVGVAWAFGQRIWPQIVRRMAEEINRKAGRQKVDPETFQVVPSAQQQAVWDALALSAGKVTTITYCAFNKSIVTEFGEEWGWLVEMLKGVGVTLNFATVNSLGNKSVYRAFGKVDVKSGHVENLIADVLGRDVWELRGDKNMQTVLSATNELVGLCKLTLAGWTEEDGFDPANVDYDTLDQLAAHYDVELDGSRERVFTLVPQILERCLDVRRNRVVDFNDQNWIPIVLNLPIDKAGLGLADESQDFPRAKQEFIRRSCNRVICVGDENQAIYGFAGADTDSMNRMARLLNVDESLTLTSTRRCGKAIVRKAQEVVPEFEAHESNGEGLVREARYTDLDKDRQPILENGVRVRTYHDEVGDGDMVLCRVNAPLVGQALKFLKAGRKVVLRGRDFGGQLASFVRKINAKDPTDLMTQVETWVVVECKKENAKRNPSEARLMAISDKLECIQAFCDGAKTVDEVLQKIDLVFAGKVCPRCKKHFNETTDTCPEYHCKTIPNPVTGWKEGPKLLRPEGILFSSIHRAKGLESDRVFFLMPKGGECPHPMAKSAWQRQQEKHLWYIACTRAREELVLVY